MTSTTQNAAVPPTSRGAAITLRALAKRYGAVTAVAPLDLDVAPGTLVTLLGPSGCGKTTLLRLVAGLERASEGRIAIAGRDVTALAVRDRNVSMVFQSYALFPHMTVAENVAYGLISGGMSKADASRAAAGALDLVGLAALGDRAPSELSGGQQQRVAVARALVLRPDVLLFDEPLSNLDTRLRRQMRQEIRALQQRLAMTVLYVTHDQTEAMAVSDRIVVMRNGAIAQAGTPRELYDAPANAFVAAFMGEANIVEALIRRIDGNMAEVEIGGTVVHLPARGLSVGAAHLMIRPEALTITPAAEGGVPDGIGGRIARATYMGAGMEYEIESAAGLLLAMPPRGAIELAQGQPVHVRLAIQGIQLVAHDPA